MIEPNGSLSKILRLANGRTMRKALQGRTRGIYFDVENLRVREIIGEIGQKGMDFFSYFDYCVCARRI